jgi:hypothetical protein
MLTLKLKENIKQSKAFIEFVKTFSFVEILEPKNKKVIVTKSLTPDQKKWVEGLKDTKQEIKNHISGKKKMQTLDSFLDEL